ncbi:MULTISPECIES: DUF1661 domain-containing protein [Porphyromonas]
MFFVPARKIFTSRANTKIFANHVFGCHTQRKSRA